MAKISNLPVVAAPTGNETVVVLSGGVAARVSFNGLAAPSIAQASAEADRAGTFAAAAAGEAQGIRAIVPTLLRKPVMLSLGFAEPLVRIRYRNGKIQPLVDFEGRVVVPNGRGGMERVVSPRNRSGSPSLSPGLIEGEPIVKAVRAPNGAVFEAHGLFGGYWRFVGGAWRRVNGERAAIDYVAQAYAQGMQERLARVEQDSAIICILLGQSNADGQQIGTGGLVSAAPVYPDHALMLPGGPRVRTTTGASGLAPLVENIVYLSADNQQQETPLSGWVNHLIRDHEAALGTRPLVVGLVAAEGNRSYMGLARGSKAYREMQRGLRQAVLALRARGITRIRTVAGYVGGESDTDQVERMTQSREAGQMQQLQRFLSEDVRAITGEQGDVPLLLVQPGYTPFGIWSQTVREGMRQAHRRGPIVLAGAGYQFEMTDAAGDPIHRSNLGKYTSGQMLARATVAELFGCSWHGITPRAWYWSSANTIRIEFDAMGSALVLDTSNTTIKTAGLVNHGFDFDDGSGAPPAITGVAVNGLTLTITLAAAPAGKRPRLAYACRRNNDAQGYGPPDGPVAGARGTLRDDKAHVRISDQSNQYDWCPAFILSL